MYNYIYPVRAIPEGRTLAAKTWVEDTPKAGPVRSKPTDVPEPLRNCPETIAKKVTIGEELVLEMWPKEGHLSFTKPPMPRTDQYDRPRKPLDPVKIIVPAGSALELMSRGAKWCRIGGVRSNNRLAQLDVYYRTNGAFKYAVLNIGGGEVATPKTSARRIGAVTHLGNVC